MNILVEADWLVKQLEKPELKIIDCRFDLKDSDAGKLAYAKDHIPGAHYFDLEKDLSGPIEKHGGRHPLPSIEELKVKLEKVGISRETPVLVYDEKDGAFAARFWWLLTYMGHENVLILNGGYKNWVEKGYETTDLVEKTKAATFDLQMNESVFASYEEVKEMVDKKASDVTLIDSRDAKRYLGIEAGIDKRLGRIPGAVNKVWEEVLEDGFFKEKHAYEKQFDDIPKDKRIVVYCGSGVTAIPNYLALKMIGHEDIKVYIGSFSDWITYEGNELEVKRGTKHTSFL